MHIFTTLTIVFYIHTVSFDVLIQLSLFFNVLLTAAHLEMGECLVSHIDFNFDILSGLTGTNVMDLQLILIKPKGTNLQSNVFPTHERTRKEFDQVFE